MTSTVLALAHPHGAAKAGGSGTHWFAIGLLVGMVAISLAPGWLLGLIIVFDLVALGWSFGILHYADTSNGKWVLIAVLFLLIGMFWGVIRGLRHLGEHEFLTRLGGIRSRGRWI
jgi:hypothetical protein